MVSSPPARRSHITAATALVVLAGAVVVGWFALGERVPPATALTVLEGRLVAQGGLTEDDLSDLADLRESAAEAGAGGAALARRAEAIELTARLCADESAADAGQRAMRLAQLVRPGGVLDERLLDRVERALLAAGRIGALHTVLYAARPAGAAIPDAVAPLARAIAADGTELFLPPDERAFLALYHAPGISDAVRGRLLVRRAEAILTLGEMGYDVALRLFARALGEHGTPPDTSGWPTELLVRCQERFVEATGTDGSDAPQLMMLLVRAGAQAPEPKLEQVRALYRSLREAALASHLSLPEAVKRDAYERGFLIHAYLIRHALAPRSDRRDTTYRSRVPLEWIVERASLEASKPAARRDAALLTELAWAAGDVLEGEPDAAPGRLAELARPWIEAARGAPDGGRWRELQIGLLLERIGERDAAVAALERAWAAQKDRRPSERWPVIPEVLAGLQIERLADAQNRGGEDLDRLAELLLEAAAVQLAQSTRLLAHVEAAGAEPDGLARAETIILRIQELTHMTLVVRGQGCCGARGNRPTLEKLLDAAQDLAASFGIPRVLAAQLHGTLAHHHAHHGRTEKVLEHLTRGVELMETFTEAPDEETERARLTWLFRNHADRAEVLRGLGREDAAAAADAEAAAARARLEALGPAPR